MRKTENNISAFILCGGKSSRMGTEKGLVLYQKKTFVQWSIEATRTITPTLFLVTENSDYNRFGYPLINDTVKSKGPVGGIYTALKNSTTPWNLILSCDLPGITSAVVENLVEETNPGTLVSFLCKNQKAYPLMGMYHKDSFLVFTEALENNTLCLMDLIKKLNHQAIEIPFSQQKQINNINTKKELHLLIKNNPCKSQLPK